MRELHKWLTTSQYRHDFNILLFYCIVFATHTKNEAMEERTGVCRDIYE